MKNFNNFDKKIIDDFIKENKNLNYSINRNYNVLYEDNIKIGIIIKRNNQLYWLDKYGQYNYIFKKEQYLKIRNKIDNIFITLIKDIYSQNVHYRTI